MSQLDARLGRGYSAGGTTLKRLPEKLAQDERDSTAPAAIGHAELRRVVLVESDQYYREALTVELLRQGFVVHAFTDGASLLGSLATAVDADLAVLDWDLPKMSGTKLLAELRRHGVHLPVVFLTGKVIAGDDHDECLLAPQAALNAYECMAFDQGAVDFIAKSRDRQVLIRRLRRAVELTRPTTDVAVEERPASDKLRLKQETSRAYWNGVDADLTLGEYKLVHLLVSNAGSFVTYRTLYDRLRYEGFVAGSGTDGFRANVRSAIKRIRNKFRACDPTFDEIENYTGFGYCWRKATRLGTTLSRPSLGRPGALEAVTAEDASRPIVSRRGCTRPRCACTLIANMPKSTAPKRRTSRRSPPKIGAVEKTAVRIIRKLYEATGGQPQRWESLGNLGAVKADAVGIAYAIERDWLIISGGFHSVSLTDAGRRRVK